MFRRKSNRLKNFDYSFSAAYFITICIKDKKCLLGKVADGKMILNESGKIVNEIWMNLESHFKNILIDEFAVMPNHLHGIIMIINDFDARRGLIYQTPLFMFKYHVCIF